MNLRVLGTVILGILTSVPPALALDNQSFGFQCECACETSNGNISFQNYNDLGLGCAALNNRTCNVEDPQTGLIRSGRTWGCSPAHEPVQIQLNPDASILEQPFVAVPLDGALRR